MIYNAGVTNGRQKSSSINGAPSRDMLNFYITIITVPGLYDQLFLVKKLQRVKVETWPGGQSAVLGGGTTLKPIIKPIIPYN